MNPTSNARAKCFSVFLLIASFLISTETPLMASAQSSGQSETQSQKQDNSLPDAPQAQPTQSQPVPTQPTPTQPTPTQADKQSAPAPAGAAGAKAANVKGAPVAQPTGAAVAPPRQHGHRSLLIKMGLIAGAGIAVGTAVALSAGSPSRPPGAAAVRP